MGTALFTGVTGLQVHQRKLDTVASNIANVNTVGYRSSRMLFQDLFSQTLQGGAAPLGSFGGSNPQQIGLGVQIASIDTNHEQGSLVTTGVTSDLAIQGAGFFVLSNGNNQVYTRDGSFNINPNGLLTEPGTGMRVQGYAADDAGIIDTTLPITDIIIPVGGVGLVRATSTATLNGNVNTLAAVGDDFRLTMETFDSLGTERQIVVTFTKSATTNTWDWEATYDNGTTTPTVGSGSITFDSNGQLPTGTTGAVSMTAADLGNPTSLPEIPYAFDLDFSNLTHFSLGDPTVPAEVTLQSQNGYPRGILQSFNISQNGQVNGIFTNGLTRPLAQVAVASFSNVGGLSRGGQNVFLETPASGNAQIGTADSGGRGSVSGGVLENSNVDLGKEFSNLIITQRGYQANARTITAADTILQETVNLVR